MRNELHHGYTLTSLFIEAKWAKCSRRWTRFGHNGETNGGVYARDARKAYNKAHRKSSRVQLSRYQAPVEEYVSSFTWEQEDDWHWDELRTEADDWHDENVEQRFNQTFRDDSCIDFLFGDTTNIWLKPTMEKR
jgi:hypothetical protein